MTLLMRPVGHTVTRANANRELENHKREAGESDDAGAAEAYGRSRPRLPDETRVLHDVAR